MTLAKDYNYKRFFEKFSLIFFISSFIMFIHFPSFWYLLFALLFGCHYVFLNNEKCEQNK
jgi:uncharacterized membrane protein